MFVRGNVMENSNFTYIDIQIEEETAKILIREKLEEELKEELIEIPKDTYFRYKNIILRLCEDKLECFFLQDTKVSNGRPNGKEIGNNFFRSIVSYKKINVAMLAKILGDRVLTYRLNRFFKILDDGVVTFYKGYNFRFIRKGENKPAKPLPEVEEKAEDIKPESKDIKPETKPKAQDEKESEPKALIVEHGKFKEDSSPFNDPVFTAHIRKQSKVAS